MNARYPERLTDDEISDRLLNTDSDDRPLKNEAKRRGLRLMRPGNGSASVSDHSDDTELTALVRKAYREGYRGEFTDDPDKTVEYMLGQIDRNMAEEDIDFEPIRKFWNLWRDRYSKWRVTNGLVRV